MDPALLLFAFTAGAAAFFAPCCIAMLPAYVGYAVRPRAGETARDDPVLDPAAATLGRRVAVFGLVPFLVGIVPLGGVALSSLGFLPATWLTYFPGSQISLTLLLLGAVVTIAGLMFAGKGPAAARGAAFGGLATLGFFAVFLVLGLPVAFLARSLIPYLPWVAAAVGLTLVVLGVAMLAGKTLAPKMPMLKADVSSPKGFFMFGVGYGTAGLSCTFPLFLAVVGAGAVSGGFLSALAAFAAFALGKGTLLTLVTALTVAGGESMGARVRRYTRHVQLASAWLLILAGGYVGWYFGKAAFGYV